MPPPAILIADDDKKILAALNIRLRSMGYDVQQALNGDEALDIAKQNPPALLILDINMPGCDGFSLIERMDKIPGLGNIPVIYITGADRNEELDNTCERLGAMILLRKPFETQELLENINLVLPAPEPETTV